MTLSAREAEQIYKAKREERLQLIAYIRACGIRVTGTETLEELREAAGYLEARQ